MRIHELDGKTICVLGYGKEGRATVTALEQYAPNAEITIADRQAAIPKDSDKHWWQLGDGWLENLKKFDIIIKSPGIPPQKELEAHAEKTIGAVQIFLDTIAGSGAVVIGVTGSKGKSTTSALIAAMLKAGGKDVGLVGNIGDPSIAHIGDAKKGTIFVHELSSYMLQDLTSSPHVAVVTSFFPEHLDYHGSIEAYLDAKKNIARFQREEDATYFNADAPGAVTIAQEGHGRKIPVHAGDCPIDLTQTKLIGEHNRANIALAWRVVEDLGIRKETAIAAAKTFQPLPHRLESLGVVHGIEWIDDAISTTPESAIAALDALGDRVATIILGGQDRGNDFRELAKRLKDSSVKTIILFPGSGPRIREEIEEVTSPPHPLSTAAERGNHVHAEHVGKQYALRSAQPSSQEFALDLRKNMTNAEQILWEALRNRRVGNAKFRRQHPIGKYIADFFCASANLAIELDGSIHNTEEKRYSDSERDAYLKDAGITTIRLKNDDVIHDLPHVLKNIEKQISPLHLNGEGPGVRLIESNIEFFEVSSMDDAVRIANEQTPAGQIVLLSTASPSYGMFKNFEEKGDAFAAAIHAL